MCPLCTRNLGPSSGSRLPGSGTPSTGEITTCRSAARCAASAVPPTHGARTATSSGSGPPANRAGTRHARSSGSVLAGDCSDALSGLGILSRIGRLGYVHNRPDEEFHLRREQTRVTSLLNEVEHVVSSVQSELRREQATSSSSSPRRCVRHFRARTVSALTTSQRRPASRASSSGICLDPAEIP